MFKGYIITVYSLAHLVVDFSALFLCFSVLIIAHNGIYVFSFIIFVLLLCRCQ